MPSVEDMFRGKRILVVEDEFLIGLAITSLLGEHGAEPVGPCVTLSDALARCEQRLDGAILDLMLGHERSTAVARHLLQRHIPFILMTGHADDMVPSEFSNIARLPKPFEESALLDACRDAFA